MKPVNSSARSSLSTWRFTSKQPISSGATCSAGRAKNDWGRCWELLGWLWEWIGGMAGYPWGRYILIALSLSVMASNRFLAIGLGIFLVNFAPVAAQPSFPCTIRNEKIYYGHCYSCSEDKRYYGGVLTEGFNAYESKDFGVCQIPLGSDQFIQEGS